MVKRVLGGVVAALTVAGGLVAVSATSASAVSAAVSAPRCSTSTLANTRGWKTAAGGTVKMVPGGVRLATPVQNSRVSYTYTLPSRVRLADVRAMSYELTKLDGTTVGGVAIAPGNDAALAAYRLHLDLNNGGPADGTIVYEPYYQIPGSNPTRGQTRTWHVEDGSFWTNSSTINGMTPVPGGGYDTNLTLAQIVARNPEARVVAIEIGQGTYNDRTVSRVNEVRFDGGRVCQELNWKAPAAPSWRVSFTPARCGDRSSTVTVLNTGRVNITVRFNSGRTQTVKPGRSAVERFRSGRVSTFVNGHKVADHWYQQAPCRSLHADSRR